MARKLFVGIFVASYLITASVIITLISKFVVENNRPFQVQLEDGPLNISGVRNFVHSDIPVETTPERVWRPPKFKIQELDDYLIYEDELQMTPLIAEPCWGRVLILICSAIDNFQQRHILRYTWLKKMPPGVQHVFLVGSRSQDNVVMNMIRHEAHKFGDIVQFPFEDTYRNLTAKVISGLNFSAHCRQLQFVIRTDDDFYLDVTLITERLNNLVDANHNKCLLQSIFGFKLYDGQLERNSRRYHYVPYRVYNKRLVPNYFMGGFVIYGRNTLEKLVNTTLAALPALFIEDVFITGFMADRAGITRYELSRPMFVTSCRKTDKHLLRNSCVIGDKCRTNDLLFIDYVKKSM